jgi:branched-chain amino acid transport system permease protein
MLFGLILIVMMIYRPEGLIPAQRRKREMQARKQEQQAETGATEKEAEHGAA